MATSALSKEPDVKEMALSNTRFTLDLLQKCASDQPGENIFYGPFSITAALGMTYQGASGETAKQMQKVLRWNSPNSASKGFGSYLPLLEKAGSAGASAAYTLTAAQKIFVDSSISLKQDFSNKVTKHFNSDAKVVNIRSNPDGERREINKWVGEQTKGKITELLPDGSLDALTAMVLVQAMYFKGNWKSKFADFF